MPARTGPPDRLAHLLRLVCLLLPVALVVALVLAGSADADGHDTATSRVVVLGDSITADNVDLIEAHLESAGHDDVHFAALGARRIDESYEFFGWRNSGLDEVAAIHAEGIDPDLWVVELGTNDLPSLAACRCDNPSLPAGALIDKVLAAIGDDEPVVWVTVHDRNDPESTDAFNRALRVRANRLDDLSLLDWHGVTEEAAPWFLDHVHPNRVGALMLARLYRSELDRRYVERAPVPSPITPVRRL